MSKQEKPNPLFDAPIIERAFRWAGALGLSVVVSPVTTVVAIAESAIKGTNDSDKMTVTSKLMETTMEIGSEIGGFLPSAIVGAVVSDAMGGGGTGGSGKS